MKITKEDIFTNKTVTQNSLKDYFNKILEKNKNNNIDFDTIREDIAEVLDECDDYSRETTVLAGNSISYLDFVRMLAEDQEAYNLFHPEINEGQFSEIESQFNSYGNKLISYFKNHPESDLYPFVVSETGVNKKQLTQALSMIGLKPDIDGSVIPVTISDNFLTRFKES